MLRRCLAFAIDMLIFSVYLGLLFILSTLGLRQGLEEIHPALFHNPVSFDLFAFLVVVLPLGLYFILLEFTYQGTLGKKLMNLEVVNDNGMPISFKQSLIRTTVKLLPWQTAHTAVFQILLGPESKQMLFLGLSIFAQAMVIIYFLTMVFSKEHQSVYDKIAKTYVKNQA